MRALKSVLANAASNACASYPHMKFIALGFLVLIPDLLGACHSPTAAPRQIPSEASVGNAPEGGPSIPTTPGVPTRPDAGEAGAGKGDAWDAGTTDALPGDGPDGSPGCVLDQSVFDGCLLQ